MNISIKITKNQNSLFYGLPIGSIVKVPITMYVAGVVSNEIGNAPLEACKAQAIVARTNAYVYHKSNKIMQDVGTHVQAFSAPRAYSDQYHNALLAAQLTQNLILCYDGKPCSPCSFSASNGGRTTSSAQRWGGQRAWLIARDDPWDKEYKRGHGVGMSQVGAIAMAKANKTYAQILSFYYPNTKITSIYQEVKDTMISTQAFVDAANAIHKNYKVKYVWSQSGKKNGDIYECDCRGYAVIWSLRLCGKEVSCPGTNYSIRKQMRTLHPVSSVADLQVGEVVYKIRRPGDAKYDLPSRYKKGQADYNSTLGLLDSYHIGVVVQTTPSLIIRHCSSGGIRTDTKLGNWSYAGFLKYVSGDQKAEQSAQKTGVMVEKTVIGPGKLNLREAPNRQAPRILYLKPDTKVTILEEVQNGEWSKIKYNNTIGYAMTQYLT